MSFASMGQSTTAPAVARPGVASSSGTHGESPDEARSPVPLAHGDSAQEVQSPLTPFSDEWYMPAQRLCTDVRSLNSVVVTDPTFTTPLHPRRWGTYTAADFSAALFSQPPPDDAGALTQDDSFEWPKPDFSAAFFNQSPPDDAGTLTQDDSFEWPYRAHRKGDTPSQVDTPEWP